MTAWIALKDTPKSHERLERLWAYRWLVASSTVSSGTWPVGTVKKVRSIGFVDLVSNDVWTIWIQFVCQFTRIEEVCLRSRTLERCPCVLMSCSVHAYGVPVRCECGAYCVWHSCVVLPLWITACGLQPVFTLHYGAWWSPASIGNFPSKITTF